MSAKSLRFTAVAVLILALALALPCRDAFAEGHGGGGHGGGGWGGGGRHYYNNGGWYRHGWFGFDVAVSALAIGAIIDSLPPRCSTVVVGGVPYYYYGNYYYQPYPYGGYVVVPPPVVTQPIIVTPEAAQPIGVPMPVQPQAQGPNTVTINIPNSRGGYTAIMLKKYGNGFVGPQGEYYSENPTVDQLKTLYGRLAVGTPTLT